MVVDQSFQRGCRSTGARSYTIPDLDTAMFPCRQAPDGPSKEHTNQSVTCEDIVEIHVVRTLAWPIRSGGGMPPNLVRSQFRALALQTLAGVPHSQYFACFYRSVSLLSRVGLCCNKALSRSLETSAGLGSSSRLGARIPPPLNRFVPEMQ